MGNDLGTEDHLALGVRRVAEVERRLLACLQSGRGIGNFLIALAVHQAGRPGTSLQVGRLDVHHIDQDVGAVVDREGLRHRDVVDIDSVALLQGSVDSIGEAADLLLVGLVADGLGTEGVGAVGLEDVELIAAILGRGSGVLHVVSCERDVGMGDRRTVGLSSHHTRERRGSRALRDEGDDRSTILGESEVLVGEVGIRLAMNRLSLKVRLVGLEAHVGIA